MNYRLLALIDVDVSGRGMHACAHRNISCRFLGDMEMNLWDCGGQDLFYEAYFNHQQDFIFRSVEVRAMYTYWVRQTRR